MELKDVSFSYCQGGELILDGLTVSFPETGLFCILGRSGSGKTTLLHLMAGMITPTRGRIENRGRCALVLQDYDAIDGLTAGENAALNMTLDGVSRKEREARVQGVFARLGISLLYDRFPDTLSGGERQRVANAEAICAADSVILADEPTGSLGASDSQEVMSLLREASRTKLVIIATHEVSLAQRFSDSIFRLENGKLEIIANNNCESGCNIYSDIKPNKMAVGDSLKLSWALTVKRRMRFLISGIAVGFSFSALAVALNFGWSRTSVADDIFLSFYDPGTMIVSQRVDIEQTQGMTLTRNSELSVELAERMREEIGVEILPSYGYFFPQACSIELTDRIVDLTVEPYLNPGILKAGRLPSTPFEVIANTSFVDSMEIDEVIGYEIPHRFVRNLLLDSHSGETFSYVFDQVFTVTGLVEEDRTFNAPALYYSYREVDTYFGSKAVGEDGLMVRDILQDPSWRDTEVRGYRTIVCSEEPMRLKRWLADNSAFINTESRAYRASQASEEMSDAISSLSLIFLSAVALIGIAIQYYAVTSIFQEAAAQCARVMAQTGRGRRFFASMRGMPYIFTAISVLSFGGCSLLLSALIPHLLSAIGLPVGLLNLSVWPFLISSLVLVLLSLLCCSFAVFRLSRSSLQNALRSFR